MLNQHCEALGVLLPAAYELNFGDNTFFKEQQVAVDRAAEVGAFMTNFDHHSESFWSHLFNILERVADENHRSETVTIFPSVSAVTAWFAIYCAANDSG